MLEEYIKTLITTIPLEIDDPNSKSDYKRLKSVFLTDDEWLLMSDLVQILGPFAEATDLLGGSEYSTFSLIYPTLMALINQLTSDKNNTENDDDFNVEEESEVFHEAGEVFFEEIEDHQLYYEIFNDDTPEPPQKKKKISFSNPTQTEGLADLIKERLYFALIYYYEKPIQDALIASLLDPRSKYLRFLSQEKKSDVITNLRKEFNYLKNLNNSLQNNSQNPERNLSSKPYKRNLLTSIFSNNNISNNEFDKYLELQEIDYRENPFNWWLGHKNEFPILIELAKKYLSIPAASTSSERVFSDAGNLMTAKRTSLKPSLFEKMLFLKRNMKFFGTIF